MSHIAATLNIFLPLIVYGFGARILGISPTPSYSHQIVFNSIWRELSLNGHQLVVITTDPINDPSLTNLTEIDLHSISYKIWNEHLVRNINSRQESALKSLHLMILSGFEIAEAQFKHEKVQALIQNKTEHFDLVIVEFLIPMYYAFAEHFRCPFIGVTTLNPPPFSFNFIGNPSHPVAAPDQQFEYDEQLNIFQRMKSSFAYFMSEFLMDVLYTSRQQEIVTKNFGKEMPHIHAIARNVSLLFINTEPIFHQIHSLIPSVIQIGGNIRSGGSVKPLPKDLEKQLNDAKEGFIYFSLGSNVKSKDISTELRNSILETFAELRYKVLWKFELDTLSNKSDNVIISKWLPQESVLKHPNIKLFITQGGLQSMEEAISSTVPMLGMPFFADQFYNVRKMVIKGMGLSIDYTTLNKEDFKNKIIEVIENPQYKMKTMEIRTLINDQPMTGMEKVVWWTNYVIRHKGAKHLRSPFLDIPMYQFLLLDVISMFILIIIVCIIAFILMIKTVKHFVMKLKVKTD